tara:strand:- start:165 stop:440 length:276 start_codon:yes stop_codon:yes gene_type:complete
MSSIKRIEEAGFKQSHDFPDEYYVKKFRTLEGEDRYVCISIHIDENGEEFYSISLAGADWHEPVEQFNYWDHDPYEIEDVIWEADAKTWSD